MAVYITQTPKKRENSVTQPISQSTYPLFTSWTNTSTNLFNDYKYIVELIDETGVLADYSIVAQSPNLFGTFSTINYIDSQLEYNYLPTVSEITPTENEIKNYQTRIIPYNNGAKDYANASTTSTYFVRKASTIEIDWDVYQDFLNIHPPKELTSESYATNKALYGVFSNTNPLFNVTWSKVQYTITKANGTIIDGYIVNPFTKPLMVSENSLTDSSNRLLEIPIGPQNLNDMVLFIAEQITLPNGFIYTMGGIYSLNIEDGDSYTYQLYHGTSVKSSKLTINVSDCHNRFEPLTINFLRENGAYDAFTFYLKSEEYVKNKQLSYLRQSQKRYDNKTYRKNEYDRGATVYKDDIINAIIANTDWLTNQEVLQLKDLWTSTDIYIQKDGHIIPVLIGDVEKPIYDKNNTQLSKYEIRLDYSNKKYRI